MAEGYIPYSKIKNYGQDDLDLVGDSLEFFISVIRQIDADYISDSNKKPEQEKSTEKVIESVSKLAAKPDGTQHQKTRKRKGGQ